MGTHLNDAFGADGAVVRASRLREETFRAGAAGEVGAGRSVAGITEGSVEIVEQHVQIDEKAEKEVEIGDDSLHVHEVAKRKR